MIEVKEELSLYCIVGDDLYINLGPEDSCGPCGLPNKKAPRHRMVVCRACFETDGHFQLIRGYDD